MHILVIVIIAILVFLTVFSYFLFKQIKRVPLNKVIIVYDKVGRATFNAFIMDLYLYDQ